MNAVVHVGPHKTGTTTIQTYSKLIANELLQDNYEMPWMRIYNQTHDIKDHWPNQAHVATCFITTPTNGEKLAFPCREDFLQAGQEIAQQHHSLLITAETLDLLDLYAHDLNEVQMLSQYLSPWQNVTIVVSYRRYYEWLISYHNELSKKVKFDVFRANATEKLRPSILDFLSNSNINIMDKYASQQHAFPVAKRFQRYFQNVVIMNLHDRSQGSQDFSKLFYCNVIPHAPRACQAVQNIIQKMSLKSNKSTPLEYQDMAYVAHHRGMIDIQSEEQMNIVIDQIRDHHEKTLNKSSAEFQRNCPSKTVLENLLQTSMQAERELLPHFFASHDGEKELKRSFEVSSRTSLCEVDIAATLKSPNWKEFFHSLHFNKQATQADRLKKIVKKLKHAKKKKNTVS